MLRKRIQELQTYRRLGLRSAGDIEKYDADLAKRVYMALISLAPSDPLSQRYTRERRWTEIGTLRSGSTGMDQHVNLPSQTKEDRKGPNPHRAVKRMVFPSANLVSQRSRTDKK